MNHVVLRGMGVIGSEDGEGVSMSDRQEIRFTGVRHLQGSLPIRDTFGTVSGDIKESSLIWHVLF